MNDDIDQLWARIRASRSADDELARRLEEWAAELRRKIKEEEHTPPYPKKLSPHSPAESAPRS